MNTLHKRLIAITLCIAGTSSYVVTADNNRQIVPAPMHQFKRFHQDPSKINPANLQNGGNGAAIMCAVPIATGGAYAQLAQWYTGEFSQHVYPAALITTTAALAAVWWDSKFGMHATNQFLLDRTAALKREAEEGLWSEDDTAEVRALDAELKKRVESVAYIGSRAALEGGLRTTQNIIGRL